MRFHLPTGWPAAPRSRRPTAPAPVPPRPREPVPAAEPDRVTPPPPASRWTSWIGALSRLGTAALRPTRALTGLVAGGVAAALLWLGIGWETDPDPARVDRDSPPLSVDQETPARRPDTGDAAAGRAAARRAAAAERAAAERAAADKALAAKVLAAQAADERAAAERAAEAKAALAEQTPKAVVAMPSLIGLKLDTAMDVAAGVGLTGLTVCRTPDDDTPLWWSNWQVTGQDVPAGTRVRAGTRICLSAVKP